MTKRERAYHKRKKLPWHPGLYHSIYTPDWLRQVLFEAPIQPYPSFAKSGLFSTDPVDQKPVTVTVHLEHPLPIHKEGNPVTSTPLP